jgi:hypothetical protein
MPVRIVGMIGVTPPRSDAALHVIEGGLSPSYLTQFARAHDESYCRILVTEVVAEKVDGVWWVTAIGAPHIGERSEKELIAAFAKVLARSRALQGQLQRRHRAGPTRQAQVRQPQRRRSDRKSADASGTVPTVPSEVLCSLEYARQRLALLRNELMIEALHVQRAVEVVTRMRSQSRSPRGIMMKNSPFRERRTPASVIRTRVTSIGPRLPARRRSACAVASPARTSSTICC